MKFEGAEKCFNLLGLPVSFEVDLDKLNRNYRDVQRTVHPDNFANATARERMLSVQKASQINDAAETLKSPLKRAIYLLSLYGIRLDEKQTAVAPGFLMQQMELRETLAQIPSLADPMAELDKFSDNVRTQMRTAEAEFSTLFGRASADNAVDKDSVLNDAQQVVLRMQFLNKLDQECLALEEELVERY